MHAEINVRFEFTIDDNKTLPLATLAEFISNQDIKASVLETVVKSLDEQLVEALCGKKHAHGNGDKRFQRRGTKSRLAVTTVEQHDFVLHYVEDTDEDLWSVLDASVNADWDEIASSLETTDAITDDAE